VLTWGRTGSPQGGVRTRLSWKFATGSNQAMTLRRLTLWGWSAAWGVAAQPSWWEPGLISGEARAIETGPDPAGHTPAGASSATASVRRGFFMPRSGMLQGMLTFYLAWDAHWRRRWLASRASEYYQWKLHRGWLVSTSVVDPGEAGRGLRWWPRKSCCRKR